MSPLILTNDDADLLQIVREALADAGHRAILVDGDPHAALRAIRRTKADALLTGVGRLALHLPGWELVTRLWADDALRELPIVAWCADRLAIEHLREAGATHRLTVLAKPFDLDELLAAVAELGAAQSSSGARLGAR